VHISCYNTDEDFDKRLRVSKYWNMSKAITIEQLDKHYEEVLSLVEKCSKFMAIIDKEIFDQNRITSSLK
jgi:hypothetical protein